MSAPTNRLVEQLKRAEQCPRFESCSAPVCPLMGMTGRHLRGDPVCAYLKEAVKDGGEARLKWYLPEHLVEGVVEAVPVAIALHGDIAKRLLRASEQTSKLDGAARARTYQRVSAQAEVRHEQEKT